MPRIYEFIIAAEQAKERIDRFLALQLPDVSRARFQALLSGGNVLVNDKTASVSYRLKLGDRLQVTIPEPRPLGLSPTDIPLDVLYADSDIVVLNKQAGLVVHPGAGHHDETLIHALLHHFPDMHVGGVERPGLVHRLDKETSGVLICARHDTAFQDLQRQFRAREVNKIYTAFAVGAFKEPRFELRTGHARHTKERWRFSTRMPAPETDKAGPVRLAHSQFEVVAWADGVTELHVKIMTGRTHQIRSHLADIGRPIVQDAVYGGVAATKKLEKGPVKDAAMALKRQALHASRLEVTHPTSGERMTFVAPLPADLQALEEAIALRVREENVPEQKKDS